MDTSSPIFGFITRKELAELCERSERSLQRYWSKAIDRRSLEILTHLKLRTEDGEVIDGPTVTKDLIEQLKTTGRVPTWFVEREWGIAKYEQKAVAPASDPAPESLESETPLPAEPTSDIVVLLREQVADLKAELSRRTEEHVSDKRRFDKHADTMKQMFDALKEDGVQTKQLLHSIVERLPQPKPTGAEERTVPTPTTTVIDTAIAPKRNSAHTQPKPRRKKAAKKRRAKQPTFWQRDVTDFIPFLRK